MIKLGNKEISKLFIGGKEIGKVCVGDKVVWPEGNAGGSEEGGKNWSTYRTYAPAVLWDSQKEEKIIVEGSELENYDKDRYTPIGVLVIPPEHDVYGTGEGAMMSLNRMSCENPDKGSEMTSTLCWGQYNVELDLPKLTKAPIIDAVGNITGEGGPDLNIASDNWSSNEISSDIYDTIRGYRASNNRVPSPFLNYGSRNPLYYSTESPSSEANCLADFDGIGNSQVLWAKATAQPEWRTDSTIKSEGSAGYSPAACCCWRYHTEGTQQGDWYLPAMGELVYVGANLKAINTTIKLINSKWSTNIKEYSSGSLWSSSVYGLYTICSISLYSLTFTTNSRSIDITNAVAFYRISSKVS